MAALTATVAFMILFNIVLVSVNQMGVGPSNQFIGAENVNIANVQKAAECAFSNATQTTTCTPNFGNIPLISNFIAFGDFLWSLAQVIAFFPAVIALPYIFLTQDFYAPALIAALYNALVWIIFVFWLNQLVSGRYQFEIE